MKKVIISFLIFLSFEGHSSDLKISRPILYMEHNATYAIFNLSWKNAWSNASNHDGIWLFGKSNINEGGYRHIRVKDSGHEIVDRFSEPEPNLKFEVSPNGIGLMLYPSETFRGDIEVVVKLSLEQSSFEGIDTRNSSFVVYGIEMVQIPKGSFMIGDSDSSAIQHGAFYRPNTNGDFDGLVKVESEDQEFTISKNGDLYYQVSEGYEGDQKGLIPTSFPKGVQSFYIMKYELAEQQYTRFLNSLTQSQQKARAIDQEEGYTGSIAREGNLFVSTNPDRPCSFVSWDDAMAYADWAGLRPMIEFEFTKAARKPLTPNAKGFPWGTDDKEQVQRFPDDHGNLVMRNGWGESKLNEDTKKYFGASYYWVMDLAGSLWERVVTVGHENGRSYKGTHGDGTLSEDGKATNEDWPIGTEGSGGIGYRGGGFYGYDREYHEFNPFSPVAYRPYGAWHGAMRHKAYGTRFVITLPKQSK